MTYKADFEKEYQERFEWRKNRQIENLKELSEIAQSGGAESLQVFSKIIGNRASDNPKDALRWSILYMWFEATECYVYGEFQASILVCGAVVERCLKLEYEIANGVLPKGKWTLGKCKNECKNIVSKSVIDFVDIILDPRNDRAHALLEHDNPQLSISGGNNRGIEVLSSGHYLIEPFRGDAKIVIEATYKILKELHS